MSGCLNLWTCSPETHKHTVLVTVYLSQHSEKAANKQKITQNHETHKVSVHVFHPVSHIGHHVVEHAEWVHHHVLNQHKRTSRARRVEGLGTYATWLLGIISS